MNAQLFAALLAILGLFQYSLTLNMQLSAAQNKVVLSKKDNDVLNGSLTSANTFVIFAIMIYTTAIITPNEVKAIEHTLIYFVPILAILMIAIGTMLLTSAKIPQVNMNAGLIVAAGFIALGFSVKEIMHVHGHSSTQPPSYSSSSEPSESSEFSY